LTNKVLIPLIRRTAPNIDLVFGDESDDDLNNPFIISISFDHFMDCLDAIISRGTECMFCIQHSLRSMEYSEKDEWLILRMDFEDMASEVDKTFRVICREHEDGMLRKVDRCSLTNYVSRQDFVKMYFVV